MMEAIVGFLTGVIASMGLGGGFILVIWLTLAADVPQRTAQGINLLFFLPIALISVIMHIKAGLINKRLVLRCCLGGVLGGLLGTIASAAIANDLLHHLYALFLLAFGIRELFRKPKDDTGEEQGDPQTEKEPAD